MEFMELKNTISELKILCNGQKRLHLIKENTSEHEDRAIQNIETEKQKLSRETENDDQQSVEPQFLKERLKREGIEIKLKKQAENF